MPLIRGSKPPDLSLDTEHGTLGWTHACGSGKRIAGIVSALTLEPDFAFMGRHDSAARGSVVAAPA